MITAGNIQTAHVYCSKTDHFSGYKWVLSFESEYSNSGGKKGIMFSNKTYSLLHVINKCNVMDGWRKRPDLAGEMFS